MNQPAWKTRHDVTFSMLGGKGGSKRKGGHRTPKTRHLGVFWVFDMRAGVRRTTGVEEHVEHVEHALKGVLDVLDVRGGMRSVFDMTGG